MFLRKVGKPVDLKELTNTTAKNLGGYPKNRPYAQESLRYLSQQPNTGK